MSKTAIKELIICTSNKGKLKEFNNILTANPDLNISIKSIDEAYQGEFDPEETADSFIGNALIKAQAGSELTKSFCIADDSGIEVEGLDGRPGIYSGRYLKSPEGGIEGVLKELGDNPNRRCNFTCAMVITDPDGKEVFKCQEKWFGNITDTPRGSNGFGYDPIVVADEFENENLTIAELENEQKNSISHRAKALKQLIQFFKA